MAKWGSKQELGRSWFCTQGDDGGLGRQCSLQNSRERVGASVHIKVLTHPECDTGSVVILSESK